MGLFDGIAKIFGIAGNQVVKSNNMWKYEADRRVIHFSNNFQKVAKERGLSEADALDVYNHGYVIKDNMMAQKYNGYEIGIYYFITPDTGRVVITSVWKRERRW